MMYIKLLSLGILFFTSTSKSRSISSKEKRNLTEIFNSEPEPLCDVRTSYIYPQFEINILGKKRKILHQEVKIVKCLGLNADWAMKNTVTPVCQQNYLEVKLKVKLFWFEEKETFSFPSGCNVIVASTIR